MIRATGSNMKILLLFTGKTDTGYLSDGVRDYMNRIKRYVGIEVIEVAVPKKWHALSPELRKSREASVIERYMDRCDHTVLLDERGKAFGSVQFARFIEDRMNQSTRKLLFVAGGPWGFSEELTIRAQSRISLSPMTFSHQVVRLLFMEQLYRAMTIIRGEPYHNE